MTESFSIFYRRGGRQRLKKNWDEISLEPWGYFKRWFIEIIDETKTFLMNLSVNFKKMSLHFKHKLLFPRSDFSGGVVGVLFGHFV